MSNAQITSTGEATGFIPAPENKGKPITVIGTEPIRNGFDPGCIQQALNSRGAPGVEAPRLETWNLAPSTLSLVVRANADGLTSSWLSCGFQTSPTATLKPINARIETAVSKQLFKEAWKTRRCVVPADGWYKWKEERHRKQPYYFFSKNGDPLFFAGLSPEEQSHPTPQAAGN